MNNFSWDKTVQVQHSWLWLIMLHVLYSVCRTCHVSLFAISIQSSSTSSASTQLDIKSGFLEPGGNNINTINLFKCHWPWLYYTYPLSYKRLNLDIGISLSGERSSCACMGSLWYSHFLLCYNPEICRLS